MTFFKGQLGMRSAQNYHAVQHLIEMEYFILGLNLEKDQIGSATQP